MAFYLRPMSPSDCVVTLTLLSRHTCRLWSNDLCDIQAVYVRYFRLSSTSVHGPERSQYGNEEKGSSGMQFEPKTSLQYPAQLSVRAG